jgi:hypothetical protein
MGTPGAIARGAEEDWNRELGTVSGSREGSCGGFVIVRGKMRFPLRGAWTHFFRSAGGFFLKQNDEYTLGESGVCLCALAALGED